MPNDTPAAPPAPPRSKTAIAPRPQAAIAPAPAVPVGAGELAAAATAAHAKAAIEAAYTVALARPRDLDLARQRILRECARPRFAEAARWHRPVGGGANGSGPSIRFAESCLRALGNIHASAATIHDDDETRIVRVSVIDLEANVIVGGDIAVSKTVERRNLKPGEQAVGARMNSTGQRVYIVRADDGALAQKVAAEVSKAVRQWILRLVPADIVEEAMDRCAEVLRAQTKADPTAARKKILDGFGELGVNAAALKAYCDGRSLDSLSPHEMTELRDIWTAIRDGETTWPAVMRARQGDGQEATPAAAPLPVQDPAAGSPGARESVRATMGLDAESESAAPPADDPPAGKTARGRIESAAAHRAEETGCNAVAIPAILAAACATVGVGEGGVRRSQVAAVIDAIRAWTPPAAADAIKCFYCTKAHPDPLREENGVTVGTCPEAEADAAGAGDEGAQP